MGKGSKGLKRKREEKRELGWVGAKNVEEDGKSKEGGVTKIECLW